ncbi:MAG: glycosyltransferase family 1 protein [Alphaproteobacteria bacterium]|nr:glycosyltransferase family 1 protein [Alphaproteobacteria bacterium]
MPHFAFIDIAASYTGSSPLTDALGGTQAAVCHLGAALVKQGANVTLINQNREAGVFSDLASIPPEKLDDAELLSQFDALIINGRWTKKLVQTLRGKTCATNAQAVATSSLKDGAERRVTKIYGWMHEACFNDPWILPLQEFDGFIFVSNWQKNINAPLVPPHAKAVVIPNGIAPGFQELSHPGLDPGSKAPIVIYAGSSKRGLFYLPQILPALKQAIPDLSFEIYSDCNVDNDAAAQATLRAELLAISGVTHVGGVSQNELPQRFKRARYFISPNPYPETFCICLAEAMAAGCVPIITARAALPETAHGFGALVPITNPDSVNYEKDALDINAFITKTIDTIRAFEIKPTPLNAQIDFVNRHYNWDLHAKKWLEI